MFNSFVSADTQSDLWGNATRVWHLNELVGTQYNDSKGGINFTNNGAEHVTAKLGNGSDLVAANTDFLTAVPFSHGNNYSVFMWLNDDTIGTTVFYSQKVNSGDDESIIQFLVINPGILRLRITDVNGQATGVIGRLTSANNISINTWHHIGFTYDGGTTASSIKIYVDGAQVDSADSNEGSFSASEEAWQSIETEFGRHNRDVGGTTYFDGTVDEILIFANYTVSQTEIDYLYNSGTGRELVAPTGPAPPPADAGPNVTLNEPIDEWNTSLTSFVLNCTVTDDNEITNVSLYINDSAGNWVINETNSTGLINGTYQFTRTFGEESKKWNCLAYDNNSNFTWGTNNRTFTVDTITPPNITLLFPPNASILSNVNESLNCSGIDDNALQNISLFINGEFNQTSTLPSGNEIIGFNITNVPQSTINWTCQACDLVANCANATQWEFTETYPVFTCLLDKKGIEFMRFNIT